MKTSDKIHNSDNVVDLFSGKPFAHAKNKRLLRLSPELDGLEMLVEDAAAYVGLDAAEVFACYGKYLNGVIGRSVERLRQFERLAEFRFLAKPLFEGAIITVYGICECGSIDADCRSELRYCYF